MTVGDFPRTDGCTLNGVAPSFKMLDGVKDMVDTIPQRGILVAKHLAVSSLTSLAFGLAGGLLGAALAPRKLGPVVPYLAASAGGFAFATWSFWRQESQLTVQTAQQYPKILLHHLHVGHPAVAADLERRLRGVHAAAKGDWPTPELLSAIRASVATMSWFMLARQTATSDIAEVHQAQAAALVEAYAAADPNAEDRD